MPPLASDPAQGKEITMRYETPTITDYGNIGEHTFVQGGTPRKDTRTCTKDTHGDESCPTP